jgi:hypothetical protein
MVMMMELSNLVMYYLIGLGIGTAILIFLACGPRAKQD